MPQHAITFAAERTTVASIAGFAQTNPLWRPCTSSISFPKSTAAQTDLENPALACIDCNLHKGSNVAGYDPDTGRLTELFSPRRHRWDDHFKWLGASIVGTTAVGRTTVEVLRVNAEERVQLRMASWGQR